MFLLWIISPFGFPGSGLRWIPGFVQALWEMDWFSQRKCWIVI